MSNLLARYAEAAFWMGRYVERAESLARIIDVNDTFSRSSRGIADWNAVLQLYADEDNFRDRHGEPAAAKVIHYYLFDRDNPGSVISSIRFARENARTLRPMISTEIWEQLNTFNNQMHKLDDTVLESPGLYRTCNLIKERCQTHRGVVEATMHRDEAWYFYRMGTQLERGAQTAHYLDVRYRDLMPAGADGADAVDMTQWTALLRSQAALHGYRRSTQRGVTPRNVAAFLLFDRRFPRSVTTCARTLEATLAALCRQFAIDCGEASAGLVTALVQRIDAKTIEAVIDAGLHNYLDQIQRDLYALSDQLHRDFYDPAD